MKLLNNQLIENVVSQAKNSPRQRMNLNFHESLDANVQRMLNAMEPGTYVHPHKHENPDKFEAFLILRGQALVIEFDDLGNVIENYVLSAGNNNWGTEIAPRHWHCIISLEPGTVIYEIKDGPYSPLNDKNFATWAPKEGSPQCAGYIKSLIQRCGLK